MNTILMPCEVVEGPFVEADPNGSSGRLHELALLLMGGSPRDQKVLRCMAALSQLGSFVSEEELRSFRTAERFGW